jgi:hypothetical protein
MGILVFWQIGLFSFRNFGIGPPEVKDHPTDQREGPPNAERRLFTVFCGLYDLGCVVSDSGPIGCWVTSFGGMSPDNWQCASSAISTTVEPKCSPKEWE